MLAAILAGCLVITATYAAEPSLKFEPARENEFTFDTGILRGKLGGAQRKGFSSVTHIPSGTRLDGSMGLLSHYRVFTRGKRYGVAAWEWNGEYAALPDGSVELTWNQDPSRPFDLRAVYRLTAPDTLELQTTVVARSNLVAFESFIANYFSPRFTNALACARHDLSGSNGPAFIAAVEKHGAWQSYTRDAEGVRIFQDGRWQLEPHPVTWTPVAEFAAPLALRIAPENKLSAALLSDPGECFAVSMPYQEESHYSVYFSLFGRDLKRGESAVGRVRLLVRPEISGKDALAAYQLFVAGK